MNGAPTALPPLPPGLASLADHAALARTRLDANAWAYFSGGAGDEITVGANRAAWDALSLLPRVLRDLRGGHTECELLGWRWPSPLLLAPLAFQRMAHPDGEVASACAASVQGVGCVLSTQSSVRMETVAAAVRSDIGRGPLWFQLYMQPDRGATRELVARAEAAGYEAVVLTVDAPVHGARDRERRAGFRLPFGVAAVHLPVATGASTASGAGLCGGLAAQAATWADVEWLRAQTHLPLIVKGLLHPDDALHAVGCGAAAVIVSNHGGRTLDTCVATARALPRVVEAVAGAVPVLVDGGIQRGTDVLKALALGARAVLIGRPAVWGLANAGALGVAHVLRLLRDELEIAMALCGCATLADIDSALLA